MNFEKSVPDQFGLIYPKSNGVKWLKQAGGMTPRQVTLEGIYFPIGDLQYNFGFPDWRPEGPNFEEKLRNVDFTQISERDYNSFPEHVKQRGEFRDTNQYMSWIEQSEHYGWFSLWDDLFRFTYGIFELLDSDPRNRWDDVEELWVAINERFGFEYETLSRNELMETEYRNNYPSPEPAIRPIRITSGNKSEYSTDWAELEGEILFLLCPNAD